MLNIIVAVNNKGYIGKGNKLMWHNKEDLQLFKKITEGDTLIMGRKTWESLPVKPLPNRKSIILSNKDTGGDKSYQFVSGDFLTSLNTLKKSSEIYWVIGGEEIYRQFLPYVDLVYVSFINNDEEGDTKFDIEYVKQNMTCKIIRYCKTIKQKIYAR